MKITSPSGRLYLINKKANLQRSPPRKFGTFKKPRQSITTMTRSAAMAEQVQRGIGQHDMAVAKVSPTSSSVVMLGEATIKPLDQQTLNNQMNNAKYTVKSADNGHCLNVVNRKRCLGICVYCLKNPNVEKSHLTKVTTFCSKCPGGCWMCERCFDEIHAV